MSAPNYDFPQEFVAFEAFKDDGQPVYGTPLKGDGDDLHFYTDGHPHVGSLLKATYRLVNVEEVPCDTSPETRASWSERKGR